MLPRQPKGILNEIIAVTELRRRLSLIQLRARFVIAIKAFVTTFLPLHIVAKIVFVMTLQFSPQQSVIAKYPFYNSDWKSSINCKNVIDSLQILFHFTKLQQY